MTAPVLDVSNVAGDEPAVLPTMAGLAAASKLGGHFARRGRKFTECPFNVSGSTTQRSYASAWMRGFLAARPPMNVDHTARLDDDED
jgi:hypothetical protein